jgi:tetratricopeptide (TPR) repeat protein
MEAEGRDRDTLSRPAPADEGAPAPPASRLRAWIERPGGRAALVALVGAVSLATTLALSALRRVPEGWIGVRPSDRSLLVGGQRYLALRGSAIELFPLGVEIKGAALQVTASGGEALRGRLDLSGDLAPEVPRALAGPLPPGERLRAAIVTLVERALATRAASDLVESSPFALRAPWLPVGGVEHGLKVISSQVDLVSVTSLRMIASRLTGSAGAPAASALLDTLAARRPRDPAPLCVKGDVARIGGDTARAEALYLEALDLDPTLPEAMEAVVMLAQQTGENLDRAERLLRKALELKPDSLSHLNWLSLVLARRGDLRGAESALVRALSISPEEPTSAINLASLMDRQGRRTDAIDQLRRVLDKHPDYPMALYNLGSALAEQGDLEGAIATLERAEKTTPPSVRLYSRLAMAYEQRGDAKKAAEYRDKAARVRRDRQATGTTGD